MFKIDELQYLHVYPYVINLKTITFMQTDNMLSDFLKCLYSKV